MRDGTTPPVEAIDRAIRILEAFTVERPELGVADLSKSLGLKRSTVHRALATMESRGLLRQVHGTQKYALGPKVLGFAHVYQAQMTLSTVALPVMKALRNRCNETIGLHLLQGLERVVVQQVESTHDLRRTYSDLGKLVPLYAGSPGKLLLAFMPPDEVQQVIEETGLGAITPDTVTDPAELLRDLEKIRRQGYALTVGERSPGIASISCPVRNQDGWVIAAVNISGPAWRLTREQALEYLPLLRASCLTISRQIGYAGPEL